MSKVIWYLHHYAGAPSLGMSYRPYYLAKEFDKMGAKTFVIAASFHHLLTHVPLLPNHNLVSQQIDGVNYIFLHTPSYKGNGLKRILNMFSYSRRLWQEQKQLIEITGKPDVLIVSSPHLLHFNTARRIARKYAAKLVFEVRDLWPLSLTEIMGVSRHNPLVLFMQHIEKQAYHKADLVASLLPNAFEYMQPLGLSSDRFVVIPNGTDANEVFTGQAPLNPRHGDIILALKNSGKFLIGYTGAIGPPNAMENAIEAMRLLKEQGMHHIHLIIIGKGADKDSLITLTEKYQLESVTFLDPIPKTQIPGCLELFDVLYTGRNNLPLYYYGISPNKIFDYMLAAKPILHAVCVVNGRTHNDPVADSHCGLSFPGDDPAKLVEAIKTITKLSANQLKEMGRCGRDHVLAHYTYEKIASKYLRSMEAITAN